MYGLHAWLFQCEGELVSGDGPVRREGEHILGGGWLGSADAAPDRMLLGGRRHWDAPEMPAAEDERGRRPERRRPRRGWLRFVLWHWLMRP